MKIPNAERAIIDIRKLRDYCLNPTHDEGKHKARLFAAAFGMTSDDAEDLRDAILEAVKADNAKVGRRDEFGQRYVIDLCSNGTINGQWFEAAGLSSMISTHQN